MKEGKGGAALRCRAPLAKGKGLARRARLRQRTALRRKTPLKARQRTARKGKSPYWSIFTQDMGRCYVTGATEGVEVHHIFGAADKAASEKYGFMLPLRRDWHTGGNYSIHEDAAFALEMKQACQEYYTGTLGKTKEDWLREFRKWHAGSSREGGTHGGASNV